VANGSPELFAGPDSDSGVSGSAFFSFSRASRPSTLLSSASKTSVLGPLFFGTASTAHNQLAFEGGVGSSEARSTYHIYTGTGILDTPRRRDEDDCI